MRIARRAVFVAALLALLPTAAEQAPSSSSPTRTTSPESSTSNS
jgi:hypothetical protein